MVRLWTSFAKNGYWEFLLTFSNIHFNYEVIIFAIIIFSKPNSFLGVEWLPYDGGNNLMYLKLDESPSMILEPFTDFTNFWESLGIHKN